MKGRPLLSFLTSCRVFYTVIESDVNRTAHDRFHPADGVFEQMDWMYGCVTYVLCNGALYAALANCSKCGSKQLLQKLTKTLDTEAKVLDRCTS